MIRESADTLALIAAMVPRRAYRLKTPPVVSPIGATVDDIADITARSWPVHGPLVADTRVDGSTYDPLLDPRADAYQRELREIRRRREEQERRAADAARERQRRREVEDRQRAEAAARHAAWCKAQDERIAAQRSAQQQAPRIEVKVTRPGSYIDTGSPPRDAVRPSRSDAELLAFWRRRTLEDAGRL